MLINHRVNKPRAKPIINIKKILAEKYKNIDHIYSKFPDLLKSRQTIYIAVLTLIYPTA